MAEEMKRKGLAHTFDEQCKRAKERDEPKFGSLVDAMLKQEKERDEQKGLSEKDYKLLQEIAERNKGLMIKTETPDEYVERHTKLENLAYRQSWTHTELYHELMKEDSEIINSIILKLNKDYKVPAYEMLISYIETKFNISTVKDKKTEMWLETDGIYYPNAELFIQEICRAVLGEVYYKTTANNIIAKIQADTYVESEEFFKEADERYIPVANGIYDIRKKELLNSVEKGRFFSRIKTNYFKERKCENFLAHLKDVLPNEQDIKCMQELFGFCLIRRYSFEKFFILLGNGRNGKDKTVEVLKYMLGDRNCTGINLNTLEKSPMMLCNLHRKHANIIGELKQEQFMGSEVLKSTVGNSLLTADRKFLPPVQFINYAKHIILTNELKEMGDTTDAFFERLIIFEFPYQFKLPTDYADLTKEELATGRYKIADPFHIKKLITEEELEGVLAWSIEGLHRLLDQGGFSTSKTTLETKRLFLRKANNLTAFLEEYCDYSYGDWIEKKEFRYLYNMFCRYNEVIPLNDFGIKNTLDKFGAVDRQKNNAQTNHVKKNVWEGIKFKPTIKNLLSWMKENGFEEPNDIPEEQPEGLFVSGVEALDNAKEVRRT